MTDSTVSAQPICVHCGDRCAKDSIASEAGQFCCRGCKTVYELIHAHNLESYYEIESRPGRKVSSSRPSDRFGWLDEEELIEPLIRYKDRDNSHISLDIPQIHCHSCIWLLENLYKFNRAITSSRVDFSRRIVSIEFQHHLLSLRQLVELLSSLGYEPEIRGGDNRPELKDRSMRTLVARLAVAGFCFGNVMLLSFPEYLGIDMANDELYARLFGYIGLFLTTLVYFFCAGEFFKKALDGLKLKQINMDLPVSLGINVLFFRSIYDVVILSRAGYADSLCALVFLLLIGRWYQKKSFQSLSFDRDYRSYLPLAVIRQTESGLKPVSIDKLNEHDIIVIRNQELIPTDSLLINGKANIDYSFVSGEAAPVRVKPGEKIYAGGRQIGAKLLLEVVRKSSASYLLQLWEKASDFEQKTGLRPVSDRVSLYFTPIIIMIAVVTGLVWLTIDKTVAFDAATAVLIVACPCALALSAPFTLGTAQRIFGQNGLFLKTTDVVERMARLDTIVFDKTGTITRTKSDRPVYSGEPLDDFQISMVATLASHSHHPYSIILARLMPEMESIGKIEVIDFVEQSGAGIGAVVEGQKIKIGSALWVGEKRSDEIEPDGGSGTVYISINEKVYGYFSFPGRFRPGLKEIVGRLKLKYNLAMLTGDHDAKSGAKGERTELEAIFGERAELRFRQLPHDKLDFIKDMIGQGKTVMMIGDGLNDAGALKVAAVGLAITDDKANFVPASDGILEAERLNKLPRFLALARTSLTIVKWSFALSLAYNLIGLAFAIRGDLSPLVAAILMPASSVSVMLLATLSTVFWAKRKGLEISWK